MAKATSSKTSKAVSNFDAVDEGLVSAFVSSINLEGELNAWLKMAEKMNAGTLTVKGAKATIARAEVIGALPSIASTSAQYTLPAYQVRQLDGGETQPLKKVINTAIQGMRKLGKDVFFEKLESAKNFAEFAKVVENAPAKTKEKPEKGIRNADEALAALVEELREMDAPLFSDIEKMDEAIKFLAYLAKNARAVSVKHPSAQVA